MKVQSDLVVLKTAEQNERSAKRLGEHSFLHWYSPCVDLCKHTAKFKLSRAFHGRIARRFKKKCEIEAQALQIRIGTRV